MDRTYASRRIALALALAWGTCAALAACRQDLSVEGETSPDFEEEGVDVAPSKPSTSPDAGLIPVLDMRCIGVMSQPAADFLTGAPKPPPEMPRHLSDHAGSMDPPLEDADCPQGTTPYYRYGFGAEPASWAAKKSAASRLRLEQLARTKQRGHDERDRDEPLTQRTGSRETHQHAVAYAWQDTLGLSSRLSVWTPKLEHDGDFSLAQVWVLGGTDGGLTPETAETVEAGWQVSRGIYGDDVPRLFGYWTRDGYESGCYNLSCAGFVQVSSRFGLGARFTDYNREGADREASVQLVIVKDGAEGDWWLAVGSHWIGYWPRALFTDAGLRKRGELIEVGGEVYSEHGEAGHTKTQMGAGVLVRSARSTQAAWISHIRSIEEDGEIDAPSLMLQVTDRQCYGAALAFSEGRERERGTQTLLFGGPGYSPYCQ